MVPEPMRLVAYSWRGFLVQLYACVSHTFSFASVMRLPTKPQPLMGKAYRTRLTSLEAQLEAMHRPLPKSPVNFQYALSCQ